MNEAPKCACGCGTILKPYNRCGDYNRYIHGHNRRGKHRSPPKVCAVCGADFWWSRRKNAKICSLKCRDEWNRIRAANQDRKEHRTCYICGTPVVRKKSACFERSFCCRECRNVWMRTEYPNKIKSLRKLAGMRDGLQCVICGFEAVTHMHHIVPRRNGGTNDLENLITLCPNHHAMADRKLIDRETLQAYVLPVPPGFIESAHRMVVGKPTSNKVDQPPPTVKLSLEQAKEIRRRSAAGETEETLTEAFGVRAQTIHQIARQRIWDYDQ